jgi:O-Antigen ligase
MGRGRRHDLLAQSTGSRQDSPLREWIVAAILFGLMVVEGLRQGGFWRADALVAGVAAFALLIVATVAAPPDRRSWWVIGSSVSLSLWWLVRAQTSGSFSQFLPLGASFLAFAAAFAAVRPLKGRARDAAVLGVACLGAAGALVGFAGLIWRWYPMAIPTQGLWRLSTTLTYSDAAGLVLGVCLLIAMGTDRYPVFIRVAVCLCAAGMLASQSRGAYVAVACACCLVPWRRYVRHVVPLAAGGALGLAAIVSSPDTSRVPWLGAALILALAVAAVARWEVPTPAFGVVARSVLVLVAICGVAAVVGVAHHEIGLRVSSPSDQDRSVEWSSALHQWRTAPIVGVGPDRLLQFHAADGTYAHFVHNEYLQIAADTGIVGVALLACALISVIRVARRADVLSSCATSALVCWAVGGAFDFDWHLTFVGFLGGWCVGLASNVEEGDEESSQGGHRRRILGGGIRGAVPLGRWIAR